MITEEQKKKITEFTEKCVAGNDGAHQMPHIKMVAKDALMFVKAEGGDPEVCWTAAMLHDIVKSKPGDHGTEGSKIAEKFLLELGLDKDFVEKVRDAIYWHNKEFSDGPIERKILWDADKLYGVTVKGFKERFQPHLGRDKAIEEYYFFVGKFRTETGKKESEKREKKAEAYFARLRVENTF